MKDTAVGGGEIMLERVLQTDRQNVSYRQTDRQTQAMTV